MDICEEINYITGKIVAYLLLIVYQFVMMIPLFSTRNGAIIVEKRDVSRRGSVRDSTRNELEVYKMLQK